MTNLQRFNQDGIEIFINTATGESFASIRGYARMAEKAESTIRSRLKGAREKDVKTAEIQTGGGIQGARLPLVERTRVALLGGTEIECT